MMIIHHRLTNAILYNCGLLTIRETIIEAIENGADLMYADLGGAYLSGADLRGANLKGANLRGAYLSFADLSGANLRGADLSGADLSDANLKGADLSNANLKGADLSNANLKGAYLSDEMLLITPIFILNLKWDVLITHGYMTIGCQRHSHQEWESFTEDEIKTMHPEAFDFWFNMWRIPLLTMCEAQRNKYELAKAKE